MPDSDKETAGQSTMLKWILGLVAGGLGSAAVWIGSQMQSQTQFTQKLVEQGATERAENTKAVQTLATNVAANTETLKAIQSQSVETVKYLRDIRDDTKKFPAVSGSP